MNRSVWLVAAVGTFAFSQGMVASGQTRAAAGASDLVGPQPSADSGPQTPGALRPQTPGASRPPSSEILILGGPADSSDFWRRLKQPDWILMRPTASLLGASQPAAGQRAFTHVVSAVKLRGRVDDDLAELVLEIELSLLAPGPLWVPLGIETQIVDSAREDDKELELRRGVHDEGTPGQGRWEVRLEGARPHRLRLHLKLPVRVDPDRKRLDLAIPEAASTSLDLDVPRRVHDVELSSGESIGTAPLPGREGMRLTAHVSPRSRLSLSWTDEANSATPAAPLLAAQVEVAMNIDAESITAVSSWAIRCVRGVARRLDIRLDERDVVASVKLDDQSLVASIERNMLLIPLGEPLRPGESRRLLLETRRTFSPSAPRTYSFSGFPLSSAGEQSGAIGITQSPDLWLSKSATQGLRRIDPRELPPLLRARPGTTSAFQFQDQPFRLDLSVEDAPPLYRSESSTRMVLDAAMAHSETTIEVRRLRGRLFEVELLVPPGLQLQPPGPPDLVESAIPVQASAAGNDRSIRDEQVWKVRLTPLARDARSFALRMRGEQPIGPSGEVKLGLCALRDGVSSASSVTLLAESNVTFEPHLESEQPDPSGLYGAWFPVATDDRPAALAGSADGNRAVVAMLVSSQNPTSIQGRFNRHVLSVGHDTRVRAQISRRSLDIRQETAVKVRHGTIRSLVVRVPETVPGDWLVQGAETIRRQELDRAEGGARRYRLALDPSVSDQTTLHFQFSLSLEEDPEGKTKLRGMIPWIQVEDGQSASTTIELAAAPGIEVVVADPAWTRFFESSEDREEKSGPLRYRPTAQDKSLAPLQFSAMLLSQVPLPALVVPRLLLRTLFGPDSTSRTRAWFWIESHPSILVFRLPEAAQWLRCRIDSRPAEQVQLDASGGQYRLSLPAESRSKPVLLEVEYQLSGPGTGQVCAAPEFIEDAVILQSFWEVQIPRSKAVIGVPAGWADENQWYWDVYVWKRRPWRSFSTLLGWVAGAPAHTPVLDELLGEELDDSHGYLFTRAGKPGPLSLWQVSRAMIVAVCSGSVLLVGFLAMYAQVRFRSIWLAAAIMGVLAWALVHPSVLFLVVQSATSGVVLTLLGLLIQRLIGRARSTPTATAAVPGAAHAGSTASAPAAVQTAAAASVLAGVGSDDSTAVRARASGKMDYVPPASGFVPDEESLRGSRVGTSG